MLFDETIKVAFGAIRANKMRSVLTMLGIVIGIAAVITMIALGNGAKKAVSERLQSLGTNVLSVNPGQQMFGGNAHTVTGNGDLAFNFKLPRAAEAGVWTITVQGDKDDEAVGSFTAAAQDPNIDVSANLDD